MSEPSASSDRGRNADDPGEIPPSGWRDVLARVARRVADNDLPIIAAGVAFFALIATFPGLLSLFSLYGVVFSQPEIAEQFKFLGGELQPQAVQLFVSLLQGLSTADRSQLGFGIAGSILFTLWGASLGTRAVIRALNVAYGEEETRTLVHRNLLALLLTLGAIAVVFCMGVIVSSPPVIARSAQLAPALERVFFYARWPTVAALFWLSLLVLYRYGPSHAKPRWSWVSWGAMIATAAWLGGSGILAWYVAGARRYQLAYGSVGMIVLVLAWFLLCAFSVLLGAEINAELEHQTRRDTTAARSEPEREGRVASADRLG